jgi:hypothetical protein
VRVKNRVITAFFLERSGAAAACDRLVRSGVPRDAIRVLARRAQYEDDLVVRPASRGALGAALGALAGAILGAAAGALAAGGAVVVPGLDAFFAGPAVAALTGAGAASAAGLALGGLIGACLPAYEIAHRDDAAHASGALLAIHTDTSRLADVVELLVASGARRVARHRA